MINELSSILDDMIQRHRDLLSLAEKKCQVIISGQVDQLQILLNEETQVIEQLHGLELARLRCVKRISPAAGDDKQVPLSQLLQKMDDEDRDHIQAQAKTLLRLTEQLTHENEENKTLVQDSLAHVQRTLHVLTSSPADDYVYNPRQQNKPMPESKSTSGLFDRKA